MAPHYAPAHPQQQPQVRHHRLKYPGLDPALGLLIYRRLRRQIMRHHTPRGAGAHDPARSIEDFTQAMVALGGIFSH